MTDASPFEVHDPRFTALFVGSARLEELYSGCRWAEGPVWFDDAQHLLWSDIPNQKMMRWVPDGGVSVFRHASNFSNGNTRDREGRLISCEHGTRRVTRTEVDGCITVLAHSFEGRRLNSPNDVIVRSDGTIWFTDPTYGILSDYEGYKSDPEQGQRNVFRLIPKPAISPLSSATSCSQMGSPFRRMRQSSTLPIAGPATSRQRHATSGSSTSSTAAALRTRRCSATSMQAYRMASGSITRATFGRVLRTVCIASRQRVSCSARSRCRKPLPTSPSADHAATASS